MTRRSQSKAKPNGKPLAVIYVRVSSQAQVDEGQGAESQAARCGEFARIRGYDVVKIFEDKAVSGSLIDRPGMKDMLAYLMDKRGLDVRVIIDDISRLARDLRAHLTLRDAILKAGGILESPSITFGEGADERLVENMLASAAAHMRSKNTEQVKARMQGRLLQGYWPFFAPIGYKHVAKAGCGKVMVLDEPVASIMRSAMEGYANGVFETQAEVVRFLDNEPDFPKGKKGTVHPSRVTEMLTRQVYAGIIEYEKWKVSKRNGQHEGLISLATYDRIQERLAGKTIAPARVDISAEFPLRGSVLCGDCNMPYTSCWSQSRNGKKHPYYLCRQAGCPSRNKSVKRADIEASFAELLQTLSPTKSFFTLIKAMFKDLWEAQSLRMKSANERYTRQLGKIESDISALVDRLVESDSPRVIAAFERKIEALENEKLRIEEKLGNKPKKRPSQTDAFEHTLNFLSNPCYIWNNGDLSHRKLVQKLAFPEGLTWERNKGFRTAPIARVYSLFGDVEDAVSEMVPGGGIEPPTRGFSIRCSTPELPGRAS
jgi:site-specific DNA recombinase